MYEPQSFHEALHPVTLPDLFPSSLLHGLPQSLNKVIDDCNLSNS